MSNSFGENIWPLDLLKSDSNLNSKTDGTDDSLSMLINNLSFFKKYKAVGILIILILIAFSYFISPYHVELDPDATCYMGVTRLLLEGESPIFDFNLDYTPLVMYLMCFPVRLFGASYPVGMFTSYLVQFFDAFMVYKISCKYKLSQSQSIVASLWFLLCCLFFGGRQYLLEPFVLSFGLSAVLLAGNKSMFHVTLSGILCFCAFWSKQYGLGFLPLVLLALFREGGNPRTDLSRILVMGCSFFLSALFFFFLLLLPGVQFSELGKFLHNDYVRAGFSGLFESYLSLLTFFPLLVMPVVMLLVKTRILLKDSLFLLSFSGIIVFMMQGWVRYNYHYLMLVVPFAIWLLLASYRHISSSAMRCGFASMLVLMILIPTTVAIRKDFVILTSGRRANREACASEVAKLVPVGSRNVYTSINMLSLTLQNNYLPPCLKEHGMSNGFLMDPSEIFMLLQSADYCIIAKVDFSNEELFPFQLREYLHDKFSISEIDIDGTESDCVVFSRNNNELFFLS